MSDTRKFAIRWECYAEAESADDALELMLDAMTDIKNRNDMQVFLVRQVGSPMEQLVDRRAVDKGHSVPLGVTLRKESGR